MRFHLRVVLLRDLRLTELKKKLTSTPQREDSGAHTNSRYHYQALCGLVLVLERHKLGGDYALVFEYHDDIWPAAGSVDTELRCFDGIGVIQCREESSVASSSLKR
ncbi:dsDNA nuclease domain-containing protein [Pararhizobium sp. IMCC21322]|uniref:dsDNA nuclease domain-containing protein n=1 Tax=Pararhizobium sp. IMCC21322 TaxID=3067903 RepID=UPI0035325812